MVLFSLESVHDLGVGERHLALSLYKMKSLCDIPKLNYALESHCLFTLSAQLNFEKCTFLVKFVNRSIYTCYANI